MIDVALTPDEIRPAAVAVVIDVLRATSTAAQALAAGYRAVLCADSVQRGRELRATGRVLAGEEHAFKPPDFDQGNSPLEAQQRRGEELVLATTNGTPAVISAAGVSTHVLLACLLNLDAVAAELRNRHLPRRRAQIVCSGTDGALALEDVYVAGRLCSLLPGDRTDAALVAEALSRAYATSLTALTSGAHGITLAGAGMMDDIEYCCRESVLRVVPRVVGVSGDVAVVADPDLPVESDPDRDARQLPRY